MELNGSEDEKNILLSQS